MPALAVIIPMLRAVGGVFWGFATSRVGQLVIVAAAAWFWSGHRAHVACAAQEQARIVEMKRVHDAELAREVLAAQEIALEATKRVEDDARAVKEMQTQIDEENDIAQDSGCNIDEPFTGRVRGVDRNIGAAAPAGRARRVR